MQTFLRWAGSKRRLVSRLKTHLPQQFERYVEPFAGSACLFFEIEPARALLGDLNSELVHTYDTICNSHHTVAHHLASMSASREFYYSLRSLDPAKLSPSFRTARFIYLNRFCFNGLYRTNLRGEFNVPFGAGSCGTLPNAATLSGAARALRRAEIKCCSFEKLLETTRRGDFVYMDPPFSVRRRRVFREYGENLFSIHHLPLLKRWMKHLSRNGIPFVLSYADSKEGRELACGYACEVVMTRRNIAGFTHLRRRARELIITNQK